MFRKIDEKTFASPQIGEAEVAYAKALGIGLIVNNRPEGESDDQTPGADIEAAARAAGIDYVAIPVSHAGFSMPQAEAMQQALAKAGDKPVLAYCRSGTRSTYGDVSLTVAGEKAPAWLVRGVAIYTPNTSRDVIVPLPADVRAKLAGKTVRIDYTSTDAGDPANAGKLLASLTAAL